MWPQIVIGIGLLCAGAGVNLIITIYVFRWKQRETLPEDLDWRLTRIEQAFVAHTGVTLNGKDYKKGQGH